MLDPAKELTINAMADSVQGCGGDSFDSSAMLLLPPMASSPQPLIPSLNDANVLYYCSSYLQRLRCQYWQMMIDQYLSLDWLAGNQVGMFATADPTASSTCSSASSYAASLPPLTSSK